MQFVSAKANHHNRRAQRRGQDHPLSASSRPDFHCALMCGGETCTDMALSGQAKREFLGSFLKLEKGIPSHDTFSRVFRLLDPEVSTPGFWGS